MKFGKVEIKVPLEGNDLLGKIVGLANSNKELTTLWKINNINAIDRLGWSDHGYTHFQIVVNVALRIARLFNKGKVKMSIVKNYDTSYENAEVVIFLASLMHDLGMSINRDGHEELSLFIARDILKDILSFMPVEKRIVITSEVLHAILNHRSDGKPLTIEAGIVRVSDALDMCRGRSRIPFEAGSMNIHSLSAYAIDKIDIKEGKNTPVKIEIFMNNSAGFFQVDELLKRKVKNSGIGKFLEISAKTKDSEDSIIKSYNIKVE